MSAEQKITMLESERLQVYADLHRQKAECQAQAIEFGSEHNIVESCLTTLQVMADSSSKIVASIDRRLEEIERTKK